MLIINTLSCLDAGGKSVFNVFNVGHRISQILQCTAATSSGDYHALAEAISFWVSKKPYLKMRENCHTTAQRFDISVLVNELESLFYEAVGYSSVE